MRKILLIFFFLFLVSFNNLTSAYQNEPNGFRGLTWGMSYEQVAQKYTDIYYYSNHPLNDENTKVYNLYMSNPYISNMRFTNPVNLMFYKNQLYFIFLDLSQDNEFDTVIDNQNLLNKQLVALYGKATTGQSNKTGIASGEMTLLWIGENTSIASIAKYNFYVGETKIPGFLGLNIYSTKINTERDAAYKQSMANQAKQGW